MRSVRASPEIALASFFGIEGSAHSARYMTAPRASFRSALLLFEAFSDATEAGLVELLAWLIDVAYFKKRQSGQEVNRDEAPDLSDEKVEELQKALGGWFSSEKPILSTRLI